MLAFITILFYLISKFPRISMNVTPRGWMFPIICILTCFITWSCDEGIAPVIKTGGGENKSLYGFSGIVDFANWPPRDSIVDLRLVAFKNFPPGDIATEVLAGRAEYTDTLKPFGADSIPYTLYLRRIQPGVVRYIVVAQQYGPNIQTDWRMLAFYSQDADTPQPDSLNINADSVLTGINLHVDFNNIPTQP